MGATIVVAAAGAPDDGAGGDDESTEAEPVQPIKKSQSISYIIVKNCIGKLLDNTYRMLIAELQMFGSVNQVTGDTSRWVMVQNC